MDPVEILGDIEESIVEATSGVGKLEEGSFNSPLLKPLVTVLDCASKIVEAIKEQV
jgi:hypothetical protein